jgi:formylglycine-generating enzyme required for sulfatase activity
MKKLFFILMSLVILTSACQSGGGSQAEPTPIPLGATSVPSPTALMNPTAAPQGGSAPVAGTTRVSASDGMIQVYVPTGTFMRGGVDPDARIEEKPATKITLSAFWMDKVEVTNAMYMLCFQANVCNLPHYFDKTVNMDQTVLKSTSRANYFRNAEFADYPVIYVTWSDANTYCKWAGRRLPTEAEWEYSARGPFPSLNTFPWGDQMPDTSYANFNSTVGDTMRVGSYPAGASAFGILDLAGNVAEWVNDLYDSKYYDQSITMNPTGPIGTTGGFMRVVRGGHWGNDWKLLRVSFRTSMMGPNPSQPVGSEGYYGQSSNSVGFRCAASN